MSIALVALVGSLCASAPAAWTARIGSVPLARPCSPATSLALTRSATPATRTPGSVSASAVRASRGGSYCWGGGGVRRGLGRRGPRGRDVGQGLRRRGAHGGRCPVQRHD